jgi:CRP-like cAMP-binding protein
MNTNIEETLYRQFGSQHKAGDLIFQEGDPGNLVYLIQQGRIQIGKAVGDGTRVLAVLSRGEFFGEMAMISEKPRSATATAVDDSRLLALDKKLFFKILRSNYDIAVRLVEQLAGRLEAANKQLESVLLTDTITRLFRYFESAATEQTGTNIGDLAFDLGVQEERLKKIINKFEQKEIIRLEDDQVIITDSQKLAKLKDYLFLKEEFGPIGSE